MIFVSNIKIINPLEVFIEDLLWKINAIYI